MGDHTAFFYGTLMAPAVLHRVIHGTSTPTPFQRSLLTIRPALLHRFQRHKVRSADYPAILPANSTTAVRGTLVTGLTDGDIWRLDIFEGHEYARRQVSVKVLVEEGEGIGAVGVDGQVAGEDEVAEGAEVQAEVYVWVAGKERLEPQEWDFGEFVRQKMGRWVGTGAEGEYADVDDAVAAQDPTGGRGANGSITKSLEEGNGKAKELVESAV
ncbi:uncharacterized protein BDZ99DRAFT_469501 [Mytilinidion resinicola]|uniref:Putative gamma-glutamylcyclotransferase n=1 Tax=Mytilinidion resinicola TaxID=574789 RepID=A0A6A6XYX2_9PEZI|nr:uncharacterized protein BDZ99DRAFT_469501 [Mytilinidion resinicola]KAF2801761.1 hypothetical protein BDZ99DRAFT_469501 [Mytilinidion resinicola]